MKDENTRNFSAELTDEQIRLVSGGRMQRNNKAIINHCKYPSVPNGSMDGVPPTTSTVWNCRECGQPVVYSGRYNICCEHASEAGTIDCTNCKNRSDELNACGAKN